ncbi:MAG TPA: ArsR family transcriptional regulator [Leclercia adecarboxylata]|nr:ArsR family transcriptional regulator [Leclercia adecarboxylata]
MTILNRLYASSGAEVIIDTLQITVGGQSYWLTRGWNDITVKLENGAEGTFTGSAIDIALPARNSDGTQDLKFAISNIDGVVSTAIRNALDNLSNASLTFRRYVSSDLSAPAAPPFTLAIKQGSWTATEVQITAGYMNILDTAWPRYRYTLTDFPGLRYLQ